MSLSRSVVVAMGLAVGMTALSPIIGDWNVVHAADPAPPPTVGAKVGKPLKEAQELAGAGKFDAASAKVKEAMAVEKKTPFEESKIYELNGFILVKQKRFAEAAASYEKLIESGQLAPEQADLTTKQLAVLYSQVPNLGKAIEYGKKYLKGRPNDQDMLALVGQGYFQLAQQKDQASNGAEGADLYKEAVGPITQLVAGAEKAGQSPKENFLLILLNSQLKSGNPGGAANALRSLVRYYPKPEYWSNLLNSVRRAQMQAKGPDRSEKLLLGIYRLMLEAGVLTNPDDYVEMAQLAMEAGVPGEAEKVVETGLTNKVLGATPDKKQRHDRLLGQTKEKVAKDRAELPKLAADAEKSKAGQPDVAMGQAYLSYGQYDQAIAALERGLKKGSVLNADDAQISLGIAYMKKNQQDKAREAFKTVKQESKWYDLADLWLLRASAKPS